MATLIILNTDFKTKNFNDIYDYLANEGIAFGEFELNSLAKKMALKDTLNDDERVDLITEHQELIKNYSKLDGYRADVICLYPEFKYLDMVLKNFKDIHYHYENEHWHYIDGSSGFGFLGMDGRKFVVEINAGEYITVPEGKWQWVIPPQDNKMKAMRFFNTTGKMPQPIELSWA